jgi:hypothetical protein
MNRRNCLALGAALVALSAFAATPASAQGVVKVGVVLGLTGPLQIIGG